MFRRRIPSTLKDGMCSYTQDWYYCVALVIGKKLPRDKGIVPYLLRMLRHFLPKIKNAWEFNHRFGYNFKLYTPPCAIETCFLYEGDSPFRTRGTPRSSSKSVTLLKNGGINNKWLRNKDNWMKEFEKECQSERDEFFKQLDELNKVALDHMYDTNFGGLATECIKKSKRYDGAKTPEEQKAIARKRFHARAMIPVESQNGIQKITLKCRSFDSHGAPLKIRYFEPYFRHNIIHYMPMDDMWELPNVRAGDVVQMCFTIKPWCMEKRYYGLRYELVPTIFVW